MKKRLLLLAAIITIVIALNACGSSSKLDGHYTGTLYDEPLSVDIEGDAIVLSCDFEVEVGTINQKDNSILSSTKVESETPNVYTYEIINDNLVLDISGETVKLEKDAEIQKADSLDGSYKSNYAGDYDLLDIINNNALLSNEEYGFGYRYSVKDNSLVSEYDKRIYPIIRIYSAIITANAETYERAYFKDASIEKNDELYKNYISVGEVDDKRELELDIQNKKAILTWYGEDILGEIDDSNHTLTFPSERYEVFYYIYNDKLAIGEHENGEFDLFQKAD